MNEIITLPPEKPKANTCRQIYCERCFFRQEKNCRILHDTDFGEKPCPFFKTPMAKRISDQQSNERLLRLGIKKEIDFSGF